MADDFVGWEDYEDEDKQEKAAQKPRLSVVRAERVRSNSVVERLRRLFRLANEDPDLEDLDLQVTRYIPVSLDILLKETKFSKAELQFIYRGFKQDCPTGIVNAEKFRELYSQYFPLGDATGYAKQIFQTMDHDLDGNVNFEEFVVLMSVLSRGSVDEKLQWVFNLYDVNGDGKVTLEEMMEIAVSMYDMLGKHTEPPVFESTAKEHISKIFAKMDLNQNGAITFDEFREVCLNDDRIRKNFAVFDTVL